MREIYQIFLLFVFMGLAFTIGILMHDSTEKMVCEDLCTTHNKVLVDWDGSLQTCGTCYPLECLCKGVNDTRVHAYEFEEAL